MAEEAAIRRKANEVRAKKEEIEMARGITVEDLTKGLLNYKFTGLTFEQGEKGALRYVLECHKIINMFYIGLGLCYTELELCCHSQKTYLISLGLDHLNLFRILS